MATKRKVKAPKPPRKKPQALDPVIEASNESFPASDAPAWTSGEQARPDVSKKKKSR